MKSHPIRQNVAISITIIMLASFACKVGWKPIDQFRAPAPGDLEEMRQQAVEDEMEREQRELELKGRPSEGGFVPPVVPQTQPATSPVAPQTTPASSSIPVILRIDYPAIIPADGQVHYGWIHFTDADGDLSRVKVDMTWGTPPMQGGVIDANIDGPPTAGRTRIGFT